MILHESNTWLWRHHEKSNSDKYNTCTVAGVHTVNVEENVVEEEPIICMVIT